MQYYHKALGRIVELVPGQQFDTHWSFYEERDGGRYIRNGIPGTDLVPVSEQPVPPEPTPTEVVKVVPQTVPAPTEGFVKLINVNTETSSYALALHLPGIGKASAKKMCDRRPKNGGYKDFEHFRQVNNDLNLDEEAWERVKGLVEF